VRKLKDSRRPEILDAALDVAVDRGLGGVSMRAVAQHLGLTPMALYGYFRGKDDLLDALLGRLLAEVPSVPAGLGWREVLEHLAEGMRAVAARYPAVLPLLWARPAVTPEAVRLVDVIYSALLDAGVPPGEVARRERMLSTFVIGFAVSEANGRFGPGSLDPAARRGQLPPAELPGHQRLAAHLDTPVDWAAEFRADLRELLDGISTSGTAG
jgi:AcrR family transcriptional regulator